MTSDIEPLSINMRTAIDLLEVFVVAIIFAFIVAIVNGTAEIRLIALSVVTPQIILILIFIYYCRRKKVWSFAGASIFGAVGVILRVVVSTQPNLEVGGGLPVGITALYIVLGALVSLKNYEAMIELRETKRS
jgi:peptidoglycan/LPS O-acetylase OafA/YrhL